MAYADCSNEVSRYITDNYSSVTRQPTVTTKNRVNDIKLGNPKVIEDGAKLLYHVSFTVHSLRKNTGHIAEWATSEMNISHQARLVVGSDTCHIFEFTELSREPAERLMPRDFASVTRD
jgi:hypothetical protein